MTSAGLTKALQHLRGVLPETPETDAQLLRRFADSHDEAAFAVLVRRHGRMVLGVCRRVLRHFHDAEDAFQATFLILARKAASVVNRDSLGCWLHQVAYHVALEAGTIAARRRKMEVQREYVSQPAVDPEEPRDWQPLLDQELSRLPQKYRSAIVLCDLEGMTRKEAADHLEVPEGTLSGRLTTARRMLADRLTRRGVALSGAALAVALLQGTTSAHVSSSLIHSTAKAATLVAAGNLAALSTEAAFLATGVLKAMLIEKLKGTFAAVFAVVVLAVGGLAYRGTSAPAMAQTFAPEKREAARPVNELEALHKKVDLLQAGLVSLMEKVKEQEVEIRALKEKLHSADPKGAKYGTPTKSASGDAINPFETAPSDVEGKISVVIEGNLVKISVGSDAGLKRGHTLDVFRLGQSPKYLGRIKIIEVGPKHAVAQSFGRMLAPLEEGDRVANLGAATKKKAGASFSPDNRPR